MNIFKKLWNIIWWGKKEGKVSCDCNPCSCNEEDFKNNEHLYKKEGVDEFVEKVIKPSEKKLANKKKKNSTKREAKPKKTTIKKKKLIKQLKKELKHFEDEF
jgi:hypothetical protein